ncbi:hypothetical protein SAMN04244547_04237, partial [Azotobacter vinelandii]
MAYTTGNAIGSTDPRDLYDNAGNLDKLLNGPNPFYPDRLNQQRISWSGMEADFEAAQDGRTAEFQQFLINSAYVSLGNYAAGINFTAYNQYVAYSGQFYRPAPGTVPFTTSGTWAGDDETKLVLLGDNVLRSDLANAISDILGAAMIGYRGRTVRDRLDDIVNVLDYGADPTG